MRPAITKANMERMVRAAHAKPVARARVRGRQIFIADGFSLPPHTAYRWVANIEPTDYPNGAHVTMWWSGEETVRDGTWLVWDANHNPEYSEADKLRGRIHAAIENAKQHYDPGIID